MRSHSMFHIIFSKTVAKNVVIVIFIHLSFKHFNDQIKMTKNDIESKSLCLANHSSIDLCDNNEVVV